MLTQCNQEFLGFHPWVSAKCGASLMAEHSPRMREDFLPARHEARSSAHELAVPSSYLPVLMRLRQALIHNLKRRQNPP